MKKTDVTYYNEDIRIKFNFRVALICLGNDKILLQKTTKNDYWSLIGGRVMLGEDTKEAIIREIKEETNVSVDERDLTLIRIVENFFEYNNTKFHELLYIYKLVDNEEFLSMNNFKTCDKESDVNEWIDISRIKDLDIRPEIVKSCYDSSTLENIVIKN